MDPKEPVDFRLTIMKPLGAQWMISLYKYFKSHPEMGLTALNLCQLKSCVNKT